MHPKIVVLFVSLTSKESHSRKAGQKRRMFDEHPLKVLSTYDSGMETRHSWRTWRNNQLVWDRLTTGYAAMAAFCGIRLGLAWVSVWPSLLGVFRRGFGRFLGPDFRCKLSSPFGPQIPILTTKQIYPIWLPTSGEFQSPLPRNTGYKSRSGQWK